MSCRATSRFTGDAAEFCDVGPFEYEGCSKHTRCTRTFTRDILFVYGTPIVWAGPVDNWVRACDRILDLDVDVVVPGHGPVTEKEGARMVQSYLRYVQAEAGKRHEVGMSAVDAAKDIDLGEFGDWSDGERLAVNVHAVYRDLDPSHEVPDISTLLVEMAHLAKL